jgi:DNA repair protein RecN (Recombination protein N)
LINQELISLLTKLFVQNIFLLENLELEFTSGLNVLTGETGAGKSILLDCLGYLLGKKNTRIEIGNRADTATLIGEFQSEKNGLINEFLSKKGFSIDGNLILRQSIGTNSKRKAFINDLPCSLEMVRELGDLILDLNGQFEEQGLLNVKTHRALLDAFGKLQKNVKNVENLWTERSNFKKVIDQEYKRKDLVENTGFLEKSIQEIIELELCESELVSIESRRDELKKESQISSSMIDTYQSLNRELVEESILSATKGLERLEKKVGIDNNLVIEMFYTALEKFSQACQILDELKEKSLNSEKQLIEIEDRYHSIKRICRTHHIELDQILNLQVSLEKELENIKVVDQTIKEIEKKILLIDDKIRKEMTFLSNERHKSASKLDKKIEKELKPLKLELAKFKTEITAVGESRFGCDNVCFTTEINPGSGFKPLNKIASGGELSRFLLALKLCFSVGNNKKTQIFDEIDRGVGGATASAIGKRLLELSKHEQVLVVTHSPQVAAYSDNHLKVEKINSGRSTTTKVDTLNEEKTIREIARMLSGESITSEASAAAIKLRNSSKGIS